MEYRIYCAGCAKEMKGFAAWREPLSKTRVCGKECYDKVQKAYSAGILALCGKDGEQCHQQESSQSQH